MEKKFQESGERTTITKYADLQLVVIQQHKAMHTYYVNACRKYARVKDKSELLLMLIQRIKHNARALQIAQVNYHQALQMQELRRMGMLKVSEAQHARLLETEAKDLNLGPDQIRQLMSVTNQAKDRNAVMQSSIRDSKGQLGDSFDENSGIVDEQMSYSAEEFGDFLSKFGNASQQVDGVDKLLSSVNEFVGIADSNANSEEIIRLLDTLGPAPAEQPTHCAPSAPSFAQLKPTETVVDNVMNLFDLK
jgi:hypothetical protein